MDTPIYGGLTARQEVRISAQVRAAHRDVPSAPPAPGTGRPAMGRTAVRRAQSWLGVPYSWAGGNGAGPTAGVCAHNGGDQDCHVIGFDCSGLALYSWWPYEHLPHYAAYQHAIAGRFHPTIGQLVPGDLVFFTGYIAGGIGHVAVYAGNGMIIQAAQSGTTVMRSRLADVIAGDGPYRGATRPMSTGVQGPGAAGVVLDRAAADQRRHRHDHRPAPRPGDHRVGRRHADLPLRAPERDEARRRGAGPPRRCGASRRLERLGDHHPDAELHRCAAPGAR